MSPVLGIVLSVVCNVPLKSIELDRVVEAVQTSRQACGPVSLWYCLKRRGLDLGWKEIASEFGSLEGGSTLRDICTVSQRYGYPLTMLVSRTKDVAALPETSIVLTGDGCHCVVFEEFDAETGMVTLFDPATLDRRQAALAEFMSDWTGEVLLFSEARLSGSESVWCVIAAVSVAFLVIVLPTHWHSCLLSKSKTADA